VNRSAVGAELARHAEAFPGDRELIARFERLVGDTPGPFSRDQFVPGHLTCSACVLGDGGEQVLLVQHARLRRWLQPGGHVEPGDESPLASARREVHEECGLVVQGAVGGAPIDLDIHEIPARGAEPGHLHYDLRYAFAVSGTPALRASEESTALRWIEVERIGELTDEVSVTRLVARAVAALRGGA
jgi:8-oxo-dGTP pyrophosphatase MutT (NUDIX family)